MSHFAVLVIGDDVDEQLAPYNENIAVDEYSAGEVSEKEKKAFIEYYCNDLKGKKIGNSQVIESFMISDENTKLEVRDHVLYASFATLYAYKGEEWNGSRWRRDSDGQWYEYSTYNPDAKWDWYERGGRWAGFFKAKDDADDVLEPSFSWGWPEEEKQKVLKAKKVDGGRKGALDLEGMRRRAGLDASRRYDKVQQLTAGLPQSEKWKDVVAQIGSRFENVDQAREFYHEQARVKAFKESELGGLFSSVDDYQIPREQYIEEARLNAVIPYAYLYKGKWHGRGEMGWFGMDKSKVADEKAWLIEANNLVDSLDENVMLTIVDCHI